MLKNEGNFVFAIGSFVLLLLLHSLLLLVESLLFGMSVLLEKLSNKESFCHVRILRAECFHKIFMSNVLLELQIWLESYIMDVHLLIFWWDNPDFWEIFGQMIPNFTFQEFFLDRPKTIKNLKNWEIWLRLQTRERTDWMCMTVGRSEASTSLTEGAGLNLIEPDLFYYSK